MSFHFHVVFTKTDSGLTDKQSKLRYCHCCCLMQQLLLALSRARSAQAR